MNQTDSPEGVFDAEAFADESDDGAYASESYDDGFDDADLDAGYEVGSLPADQRVAAYSGIGEVSLVSTGDDGGEFADYYDDEFAEQDAGFDQALDQRGRYEDGHAMDGGFDYPAGQDVETILLRLTELVRQGRPMPLSASAMINKDEALELIEEAVGRMPEELRAARWMLKEREEYLERVHRDGEDILATARARAEQLVQKTEVVRAANQRARQIETKAAEDARRLRLEAEDYCDQKLGSFEIVLERTMKTVRAGRHKLQAPQAAPEVIEMDQDPVVENSAFFDQDRA